MPTFAQRMLHAQPSAVVQVSEKVADLKKQGRDIISFSIGVPNFLPANHIYKAAHNAIDGDTGTYLPGRGSEELVNAFTEQMAKKGLPYEAKEVAAAVGGKHALFNIFLALLNQEDEVLIPAPYWTSYPDIVTLLGGMPVFLPCDSKQNYKLQPEQIAAAITPKTKAFIFNNPSNPTGMVYTKEEVKALGDELEKHDIWIISDDIYDHLVFEGAQFHHLLHTNPNLRSRLACVQSISKNYGMPGWRVGVVAGPEALIQHLLTLNSNSITNINNVSMAAAAAAFGGEQNFSHQSAKMFEEKRNTVMAALQQIPKLNCPMPEGAFYAFPDISAYYGKSHNGVKIIDDISFCTQILEAKNLALVPGSAFGASTSMRISYACEESALKEGLKRFQAFFAEME